MVTDSLWLPRSACDTFCLPSSDSTPRVSPIRVAARTVAAVAVIAAAAATLPVIALVGAAGRGRVMRLFARGLLAALGVRHELRGRLPRQGALIVANHVSWLDVLVLLAYAPARLLAKREVRSWPVIGALAAAAGTVFVDRFRPRALPRTVAGVTAVLRAGGMVAVFPEGTTWCGRTGGRFRPAVFQAAIDAGAPVAPVTLRFGLAGDTHTTVAAFIGDDTLLASLRRVVAARGLHITVAAHPALHPVPGASRRALARAAQAVVQGVAPAFGQLAVVPPAPWHNMCGGFSGNSQAKFSPAPVRGTRIWPWGYAAALHNPGVHRCRAERRLRRDCSWSRMIQISWSCSRPACASPVSPSPRPAAARRR